MSHDGFNANHVGIDSRHLLGYTPEAMRKLRQFIPRVLHFFEAIHTIYWLAGLVPVAIGIYATIHHSRKLVITSFFIIGFLLLAVPFCLYLWEKYSIKRFVISFDYLPGNPLDNGWRWLYPNPRPADYLKNWRFSRPVDLHEHDGLRIVSTLDRYSIGYDLPLSGPAYNHIKFDIRYPADVMIFTLVDLSSKDGEIPGERFVKYYPSQDRTVRAEVTPGAPNEYTIWLPVRLARNGWLEFDISVPDVVKRTWAKEGWIFSRVKMFSIRGDISISPVEFRVS